MSSAVAEAADAAEHLSVGLVLRTWLKARGTDLPRLPRQHWKVLRALTVCRTPILGGHVYRCNDCGRDHFVPHSCRDRHCPSCQRVLGFDWMQRQVDALLPVPYFHLVFTLPHQLNPFIARNQAALYKLLFDAASATLLEFGRNHFKAQIGITAVLHTWSQTLLDHYHLHCIVTGGGLKLDGSGWHQGSKHWIFPVRAVSKVFAGKFRAGLSSLHQKGKLQCGAPGEFSQLLKDISQRDWVVYAKRPFAGPEQVIAYLARYTHRVGITDQRLKKLDARASTLTFAYKDYAANGEQKQMTLSLDEFVRRFRTHILPKHFVKIRHYGLLANRNRAKKVALARAILRVQASPALTLKQPAIPSRPPSCPYCNSVQIKLLRVIIPAWRLARAPP